MPSETAEICSIAIAELKDRDPELHKALQHVIFWDVTERCGISLEEFKRQASKQANRLTKIRATMQPREFK